MACEAPSALGPRTCDSGRRSARGAIIWRAGDGPRPTPEHLTPKDAEEQLDAILSELASDIEDCDEASRSARFSMRPRAGSPSAAATKT